MSIIEALSKLMAKAKEGGLIRGFKIEGRGEEGTQVSLIVCRQHFSLL